MITVQGHDRTWWLCTCHVLLCIVAHRHCLWSGCSQWLKYLVCQHGRHAGVSVGHAACRCVVGRPIRAQLPQGMADLRAMRSCSAMGTQFCVSSLARLKDGGEELTGTLGAARDARRLVRVANGVSTLPDVAVDAPVALGMAVMLGWRCVHGAVCHEESRGMMQAALAPHQRRHGAKLLEHPVMRCIAFPALLAGADAELPALRWQ